MKILGALPAAIKLVAAGYPQSRKTNANLPCNRTKSAVFSLTRRGRGRLMGAFNQSFIFDRISVSVRNPDYRPAMPWIARSMLCATLCATLRADLGHWGQ
jgi:hypothetical protein